jgi:hypothetical protein
VEDGLRKLKCSLCDHEKYILINVEVAGDSWAPRLGICTDCFKDGNIDEKIFYRNKEFIEDQLRTSKGRVKFWSNELNNLQR